MKQETEPDMNASYSKKFIYFICIVSAMTTEQGEDDEIRVSVSAAKGEKCGRCWKYREDLDENGLCGRCHDVVKDMEIPEE